MSLARIVALSIAALLMAAPAAPAAADMKIVSARSATHAVAFVRPNARTAFTRLTGFIAPFHCRVVEMDYGAVIVTKQICPAHRVSPISGPVQEWSYRKFRERADFSQHAELWQSALEPSPYSPKIYWGYTDIPDVEDDALLDSPDQRY